MAKNSVDDWSVTSSQNTDIGGTNIGEHCALSGINNAIRKVMAQAKQKFDDIQSQVDSSSTSPATADKSGTVKIVDEISVDTIENDDGTAITPSAVAEYVTKSSDYGTLDDIIPNEVVNSTIGNAIIGVTQLQS